jgi:hypothetical protein
MPARYLGVTTPLHQAVFINQRDFEHDSGPAVVSALLAAGAHVSSTDTYRKQTPLHVAARMQNASNAVGPAQGASNVHGWKVCAEQVWLAILIVLVQFSGWARRTSAGPVAEEGSPRRYSRDAAGTIPWCGCWPTFRCDSQRTEPDDDTLPTLHDHIGPVRPGQEGLRS